jgi:hydroxylaminobenzene mutase
LKIEITLLGRRLVILGLVLFLIGLIQGVLIPNFHNPRMALSAHLAAVQSGMAMAIFGLIWALVDLKEGLLKIAYYTNVIGLYAVWFAITLGAALGASRALPIAGHGFSATPTTETVVELIVTFGAVATVVSVSLIVLGLLKGCRESA